MTEVHPIVFLLLLEALAVTTIVAAMWLTTSLRRSNRERAALKTLFGRINRQSETRLGHTAAYFERLGFERARGQELATDWDARVKQFYRKFAAMYRKRDAQALTEFDDEIEALFTPLRPADVPTPTATEIHVPPPPVAPEADENAHRKIALLEDKNRRLSEELRITQETLEQLMDEYSAMFNPSGAPGKAPVAAPASTESTEPAKDVSIEMATGDELFDRLKAQTG
ncbi:MAG: hypothetical protein K0U93_26655 [Gammaproteobacteria bacterium]|nr:hypothetical protein [Gammaproteobacteria bacterium]